MKTNINRILSYIHNDMEQMMTVYYNSGAVRTFYPLKRQLPKSICGFIGNAYQYFPVPGVKLYKLSHD